MKTKPLPQSFIDKLNAVTAKRPKTVIQQILKNGYVTTEELKALGYEHAPRAARDVRELGIPLETFRTKDTNGKPIAAYKFGDPSKSIDTLSKTAGRTVLSDSLKKALIEKIRTSMLYLPTAYGRASFANRSPHSI